jgi:hypothetical protein
MDAYDGEVYDLLRSQRHAPGLGSHRERHYPMTILSEGRNHRTLGAAVGFRRFVNATKPYLRWSVSGSLSFELAKED